MSALVRVPVEPTETMIEAAFSAPMRGHPETAVQSYYDIWRAMLAAAPSDQRAEAVQEAGSTPLQSGRATTESQSSAHPQPAPGSGGENVATTASQEAHEFRCHARPEDGRCSTQCQDCARIDEYQRRARERCRGVDQWSHRTLWESPNVQADQMAGAQEPLAKSARAEPSSTVRDKPGETEVSPASLPPSASPEVWRKATPAENLRVIRGRLYEKLSPAERDELDDAADALERLARERDRYFGLAKERLLHIGELARERDETQANLHVLLAEFAVQETALSAAREALRDLLDALDDEAKAQLAAEVAADNYSDPKPELRQHEAAMIRASEAAKKARAALAGKEK